MKTTLINAGTRFLWWILGAGVVFFGALAWVGSVMFANERLDRYLQQETSQARADARLISANLSQRIDQAVSIALTLTLEPAVTDALARFGPDTKASTLPQPDRGEVWLADPALKLISERMQRIVEQFGLHSLQLVNAAGDAVAVGRGQGMPSFIGTNYADREYFKKAQKGLTGHQFLLGRITNVFALGFAAPIQSDGKFLGMVGSGLFVPHLSPAIEYFNAVVTDDMGVIVLAKDPALMMQTMPDATVNTLTADERVKRYKRTSFEPADIRLLPPIGSNTLYQWRKASRPHVLGSFPTSEGTLRVYVLRELGDPYTSIRSDQVWWFGLVSMLVLVTAALLGIAAKFLMNTETQKETLLRLNEALTREANTDPLTGCANRRHFMRYLEQERERSSRYGFDLCVLNLDIDHFKLVNDSYGHAAGDEVLKHFVNIILGSLRQVDLLGRIGGEEFSILLPQTSAEGGAMMAERIRAAVQADPAVFHTNQISITVSIGGVQWRANSTESASSILALADGALYQAKGNGRNRVEWVLVSPEFS